MNWLRGSPRVCWLHFDRCSQQRVSVGWEELSLGLMESWVSGLAELLRDSGAHFLALALFAMGVTGGGGSWQKGWSVCGRPDVRPTRRRWTPLGRWRALIQSASRKRVGATGRRGWPSSLRPWFSNGPEEHWQHPTGTRQRDLGGRGRLRSRQSH